MKNAARPKVRAQIHPRALEIVDPVFRITEGYDDNGAPLFRGLPLAAWDELLMSRPKHYNELLGILNTDYPTFAALCQKIWAKKVGHLLPFIFNRTQMLAWNEIARRIDESLPIFLTILKARQLGMSTLGNGWNHWQVWRLRDIESLLMADSKDLVYSFMDRLRIFHEELPKSKGITRSLREANKKARVPKDEMYYMETRSKVSTEVAKAREAHGRSTLHNHLAEYAFYPDASGTLGALMPQLPAKGTPARLQASMIIESTPNGKNDFYEHWLMSKDEKSDWAALFFPWMVAEDEYWIEPPPGFELSNEQKAWAKNLGHIRSKVDGINTITLGQIAWYYSTLENEAGGNQDKMDALYPSDDETCFLLRSRSIFKHEMRYLQATVMEAERRAPAEFRKRNIICTKSYLRGRLEYTPPPSPFGGKPMTVEQLKLKPRFVEDPSGNLVIWEPPFETDAYVIGIDAASGLMDSDNSVAEIVNVTKGRQMGELAGCMSPETMADECCALGWWFNCALLYPEVNSIGVTTMKRLKQVWLYPRVGREEKWDEVGLKENKFGHYTTHEQKLSEVSFLVHLIKNHYLAIASDALLAELSTFVEKRTPSGDQTFEADSNNKDDRVDALMLACFAIRQSPKMLTQFPLKPHDLVPTAVEIGIHDAPVATAPLSVESLPEDIRKLFNRSEILAVPSNPIRGSLEVIF